ncbi:hypothetical protein Slin15195_G079210 [Septoria linicola]|uniref:DUF7587 domain-containing protein n=1 Tax=Septoria linicola TaxID=215465 RepID=A0A9Q9ELN5_9PEZI|nr:hypothetical protein Slin14017_G040410 [Septoria linicola]USW54602.1 hypothetical protein Slin15195_G079210 [Septoria linicola]
MASTTLDSREADIRNQKRKAVKRAISALQASLTQDPSIPDDTLDQTIAILKDARELSSQPNSRQPSPPQGPSRGHRRSASDQYEAAQLTVWMRLRHTSKPTRGYRVQYEGAWTTVTTIGGLQASSIFPNPSRGFTDAKLKQLTSDHLDWNSRQGSPFISIFTDEQHAEDWAMKWSERNGGKTANVLHIECSKITRLFSVKEVVNSLGIDTEMLPEQYEDEYLAVNQIPTEAIVENRPIFSPAALDAAAEAEQRAKLAIPQHDPDHVRRFSPVRMNERRSLVLENGVNVRDYLNRGFSEPHDIHREVSPQ